MSVIFTQVVVHWGNQTCSLRNNVCLQPVGLSPAKQVVLIVLLASALNIFFFNKKRVARKRQDLAQTWWTLRSHCAKSWAAFPMPCMTIFTSLPLKQVRWVVVPRGCNSLGCSLWLLTGTGTLWSHVHAANRFFLPPPCTRVHQGKPSEALTPTLQSNSFWSPVSRKNLFIYISAKTFLLLLLSCFICADMEGEAK